MIMAFDEAAVAMIIVRSQRRKNDLLCCAAICETVTYFWRKGYDYKK